MPNAHAPRHLSTWLGQAAAGSTSFPLQRATSPTAYGNQSYLVPTPLSSNHSTLQRTRSLEEARLLVTTVSTQQKLLFHWPHPPAPAEVCIAVGSSTSLCVIAPPPCNFSASTEGTARSSSPKELPDGRTLHHNLN
ncbi:hypothetical protein NA56DRAFT_712152 [Hyaloscypha hepaticicola]|uniref:Uncharacterized protein n=1 Tax=Hyaloscypha hepaticicola TaxID=2082293 RepID=A0A2J6PH71_9HELO|nr:hypothetical protein NA56DRAFT_712152 [Hyaloscypha hepaticicola]